MNKKIGCIGNPPHIGHTSLVGTNRLGDIRSYITLAPPEMEPFVITLNHHQYVEPWIDQNDKIPNHKKHLETCAKNRKKRKNRKR